MPPADPCHLEPPKSRDGSSLARTTHRFAISRAEQNSGLPLPRSTIGGPSQAVTTGESEIARHNARPNAQRAWLPRSAKADRGKFSFLPLSLQRESGHGFDPFDPARRRRPSGRASGSNPGVRRRGSIHNIECVVTFSVTRVPLFGSRPLSGIPEGGKSNQREPACLERLKE